MDFEKSIFAAQPDNFNQLALSLFTYQYEHNPVYHQFCKLLGVSAGSVDCIQQIPFLPVSFFKTHEIKTGKFDANIVFESSGTTKTNTSKHHVKDTALYKKSFLTCFEQFYGKPSSFCILGLLPSYLERNSSSLVMMTKDLIDASQYSMSGFYLYEHEKLYHTLLQNEARQIPTLLIGVTYALLDFAEKYPMQLKNTLVMETGGMKGRRKEITRHEVHAILKKQLSIRQVHAEYGMTELLSQAYAQKNGMFYCPHWMKILLRDEDDPFHVMTTSDALPAPKTGLINVIDLANMYSCSFIATDDIGKIYHDGGFEVMGRTDGSDIRGCSLLAL